MRGTLASRCQAVGRATAEEPLQRLYLLKRSPWGPGWGEGGSDGEKGVLSKPVKEAWWGWAGGAGRLHGVWALVHLWRTELLEPQGGELTANIWMECPLLNFRSISQKPPEPVGMPSPWVGVLFPEVSSDAQPRSQKPWSGVTRGLCGAKWQVLLWGNLPFPHLTWSQGSEMTAWGVAALTSLPLHFEE